MKKRTSCRTGSFWHLVFHRRLRGVCGSERAALLAIAAVLAWASAMSEASGRMLGREEIGTAAANFLASDELARELLPGRRMASVEPRGALWIARLTPSGYVVMSGSDRAEPIVGFSEENYAEPEAGSPGAALVASKNEEMAALEADGSALPNAGWSELLGKRRRTSSKAAAVAVSASAVSVKPFLPMHYNQHQPFNDYAPVYTQSGLSSTRGRDPSGCVPTAAAQAFRHFRWPAILGGTRTFKHEWKDKNTMFAIRFDGRAPLDWDAVKDKYSIDCSYDMRGEVDESVRYPIARLVLWADSLGEVYYASRGSGASYRTIAAHLGEWYTSGEWLEVGTNDLSAVVADLKRGIPVQVELAGHEVLGHGWAEAKGKRYIYLNFGWGGFTDGYYNLAESADGMAFERIQTGHFPRARPQTDPLPAVTEAAPTLSWHFPKLHAGALNGFQIVVSTPSSATETLTEDFSHPAGFIAGNGVKVRDDDDGGRGDAMLEMEINTIGVYTLGSAAVLTASSALEFQIDGYYEDCGFGVEARFDGGDWKPLAWSHSPGSGENWGTGRVFLGDRIGRTVQLRFRTEVLEEWDYGSIWIDNVRWVDVLPFRESRRVDVAASARSAKLGGLKAGGRYAAHVVPLLSGNALAPAEASEPIAWRVEGTASEPVAQGGGTAWSNVTRRALGMPAVKTVWKSGGTPLQEGFFCECARGRTVFYVQCSPSVVSLRALPSHLSLVPDSAVAVHAAGGGWFAVELDASRIGKASDRSRMILTLEATDSNGTTACKDLSLRFSSATAADAPYNGTMTCTVSFDGNGGTVSPKSRQVALGKAIGSFPAAKRSGYALAGWFTAKSGGTRVTTATKVLRRRTYYAHWAKAKYKVAFDANGGSGTMARQTLVYGKAAKLRKNAFKRTGYVFLGWAKTKKGAVAYQNATKVKNLRTDGKTTTLYAKWAKKTYQVAFNANGGKGKMAKQKMTYGKTAKLRKNAFKRTEHVFLGWAKTKNGAVAYKNRAALKNLRTDGKTTTLYAKWAKKTYQVAFLANGGSGAMAAQPMSYGKAAALRANAFTWEGHTFLGWAKTATGAVVYGDRATVKNLSASGATVTLYAQWTPNGKGAKKGLAGRGAEVTTSDGTDGSAVADGDESTGWTPENTDAGVWVVLSFAKARGVVAVEVVGENLPEGMRVLLSEDAEKWRAEVPGLARYVWVAFPECAEGLRVREVRFAEDE